MVGEHVASEQHCGDQKYPDDGWAVAPRKLGECEWILSNREPLGGEELRAEPTRGCFAFTAGESRRARDFLEQLASTQGWIQVRPMRCFTSRIVSAAIP